MRFVIQKLVLHQTLVDAFIFCCAPCTLCGQATCKQRWGEFSPPALVWVDFCSSGRRVEQKSIVAGFKLKNIQYQPIAFVLHPGNNHFNVIVQYGELWHYYDDLGWPGVSGGSRADVRLPTTKVSQQLNIRGDGDCNRQGPGPRHRLSELVCALYAAVPSPSVPSSRVPVVSPPSAPSASASPEVVSSLHRSSSAPVKRSAPAKRSRHKGGQQLGSDGSRNDSSNALDAVAELTRVISDHLGVITEHMHQTELRQRERDEQRGDEMKAMITRLDFMQQQQRQLSWVQQQQLQQLRLRPPFVASGPLLPPPGSSPLVSPSPFGFGVTGNGRQMNPGVPFGPYPFPPPPTPTPPMSSFPSFPPNHSGLVHNPNSWIGVGGGWDGGGGGGGGGGMVRRPTRWDQGPPVSEPLVHPSRQPQVPQSSFRTTPGPSAPATIDLTSVASCGQPGHQHPPWLQCLCCLRLGHDASCCPMFSKNW